MFGPGSRNCIPGGPELGQLGLELRVRLRAVRAHDGASGPGATASHASGSALPAKHGAAVAARLQLGRNGQRLVSLRLQQEPVCTGLQVWLCIHGMPSEPLAGRFGVIAEWAFCGAIGLPVSRPGELFAQRSFHWRN